MDVVLASADPDRHFVSNPPTRQKAAIAGKVYSLIGSSGVVLVLVIDRYR